MSTVSSMKQLSLLSLLFIINFRQISCFWLTDSSLLQAPIQVFSTLTQAKPNTNQVQRVTQSQGSSEFFTKTEPWIRVDQQQQPATIGAECQCNADFIHEQTSSWLNKWLLASNLSPLLVQMANGSVNQIRSTPLLMSNSTGAIAGNNKLEGSSLAERKGISGNSNNSSSSNNHRRWLQTSDGSEQQASPGGSMGGAWGARAETRKSQAKAASGEQHNIRQRPSHSKQSTHLHQQQLKLAQGPRGPPGPKGDTGPRGEAGISLLRVRNRDELFDLAQPVAFKSNLFPVSSSLSSANSTNAAAKTQDTQTTMTSSSAAAATMTQRQPQLATSSNSGQGLVFVESEQLLVIGTNSGWRPVQLLPALRDFRKTIAKFSLTSSDDRRKLLMSSDSEQVAEGDTRFSQPIGRQSGSRRRLSNSIFNDYLRPGHLPMDSDGDDEDDDVDQEDDELEGEAGENGINEEAEEEEEDEDDDDEEDDNEEMEAANQVTNNNNKSDNKSELQKHRVAQVSARSAAAALVSASIENSITRSPVAAAKLATTSPNNAQQYDEVRRSQTTRIEANGERRMRVSSGSRKIRLAALNEPFSGNVHGIRGADFECKRNAAKANIKGSFRAFLASGFQNLNEVVRHTNVHKYPVVNLRGDILANSWNDLFKQPARVSNPLARIYSFDGRHVASDSNWPNKLVWHGASNGAGFRDRLINNCDGWHSDSLSKFGTASPLHQKQLSPSISSTRWQSGINLPAKRRHGKRHLQLEQSAQINGNNSTAGRHHRHQQQPVISLDYGPFLGSIDRYPCRMPLIVLCIETIGQQLDNSLAQSTRNGQSFDSTNMVTV